MSSFIILHCTWISAVQLSGLQSHVLYADLLSPRLLIITAAAAATADEDQDDQQQNHTDEDEEDCKRGDVPVRLEQLLGLQSGNHIVELVAELLLQVAPHDSACKESLVFSLFPSGYESLPDAPGSSDALDGSYLCACKSNSLLLCHDPTSVFIGRTQTDGEERI